LPEVIVETAELDPEVRAVAAAYFFFKEDARQIVHLGDGRAFIEGAKQKYDLIILDAFSATSIPDRLTTREFLQAVKSRLEEGGIVCANLWSSEASYWDMVKTYSAVFPELHVLRCAGSANNLVLALPVRTGLTVQGWVDRATAFEKVHPTGLDLPRLIDYGASETTTIPDSARILLDPKLSGFVSSEDRFHLRLRSRRVAPTFP
jgi:spermidine synthase